MPTPTSKPKVSTPPGPSPEALAAFYRLRSESLHDSHTTAQSGAMQTQATSPGGPAAPQKAPTQGLVEYIISALSGHPGTR